MNVFNRAVIAGCVALALSSASVMAAPGAQQITLNDNGERTLVVRYDDLNLASDAGIRALQVRVAHAAKRVCGYNLGTRELLARVEARTCVNRLEAEFDGRLGALRQQQGAFVASQ